jgi:2-oxoglutarate dehydrogenase complex dehydrogenase (E1) component-like enzyme
MAVNFWITISGEQFKLKKLLKQQSKTKRMPDSDEEIVDTPFKEAIAVKIIGTEGDTTILTGTGSAPWDWSQREQPPWPHLNFNN